MKFSKVNDIRLLIESHKNPAIFYSKDTYKKQIIKDIVEKRIKDSQKLYGLFNERKLVLDNNTRKFQKTIKENIATLNELIRKMLENEFKPVDLTNEIKKLKIHSNNLEIIANTTRKSMFKYQNVILQTLRGFKHSDFNKFISVLTEDYTKEKQSKNIVKSLENQNIPFRIKDGEFVFSDKKEPVLEFLKKYINDHKELEKLQSYIKEIYFNNANENDIFVGDVEIDDKDPSKQMTSNLAEKIYDLRHNALIKIYDEKGNRTDDIKKFWIDKTYTLLIQEFTAKKYNKRKFKKDGKDLHHRYKYADIYKVLNGKLRNYVTSQILSIGKSVYHFYDFDNNKIAYENLSSIDYEFIKLKETMSQKIDTSITFAIHSFLNSVDLGDVNNSVIQGKTNEHLKKILRFWGGKTYINADIKNADDLCTEINKLLFKIRNSFYHYADSKNKTIPCDNILKLYKLEAEKYKNLVFEKYKFNNVFKFYKIDGICDLVNEMYAKASVKNAYIPSFKSIYHYNTHKIGKDEEYRLSSYFLLKEIYYNIFCSDENAIKFIKEVFATGLDIPKIDKNTDNEREIAWENFKSEFGNKSSMKLLCESVLRGYADSNTKNGIEKNKHFKILLNKVILKAFLKYAESIIANLTEQNSDIPADEGVLSKLNIKRDENLISSHPEWYVLGKFSSPKQLNLLKGILLKAKQFHDDILEKSIKLNISLSEFYENKIKFEFDDIDKKIEIIEFCSEYAGRVINNWDDYYDTRDDFAKTLSAFVHCGHTFDSLRDFEKSNNLMDKKIYSDDENPILHSTIEQARMFGSYNLLKNVFCENKVSKKDYSEYIHFLETDEYKEFTVLRKEDINTSEDAQKYVRTKEKAIHLENQIKLHDVSKIHSLLIDLYSQLIAWEYKYERDRIYFLMGYLYFKDKQKLKKCTSIYIFGRDIKESNSKYYKNSKGEDVKGFSLTDKIGIFIKYVLNDEFELNNLIVDPNVNKEQSKDIDCTQDYFFKIRDTIGHFNLLSSNSPDNKYYSFLDYYNIMLSQFEYDRKQKNNVMQRFKKIFETYFIKVNLEYSRFEKTESGILKQVKVSAYEINRKGKNDKKSERQVFTGVDNIISKEAFKHIKKFKDKYEEIPHTINSDVFPKVCMKLINHKNK